MPVPSVSSWNMDLDEVLDDAMALAGYDKATGYEARTLQRAFGMLMAEWSNLTTLDWTVELSTHPVTAGQTTIAAPADCLDVVNLTMDYDDQGKETPLDRIGWDIYHEIRDKERQGRTFQYNVKRTRDDVTVYLYPVPDQDSTFSMLRVRRARNIGALSNPLDMPQNALPAFVAGLAYHLYIRKKRYDSARKNELFADYTRLRDELFNADRDRSSIQIEFQMPDGWRM